MSKIYDALQLAERERKLASAKEEQQKISTVSPVTAVLEQQQAYTAPPADSSDSPVELFPVLKEDASPQTNVSDLEALHPPLPAITPSVWTPNWARLPSLETRGPLLEQFRVLRSRVHELRAITRLKSLMIGSGLPQEGKSFVTVNLALALASSKGNRVLLIDGDMRRASIHKLLGTKATPGLSDYLGGKVRLDEILQKGKPAEDQPPFPSAFTALTFIGAGGDAENAADLSGNQRFGELLRILAPHFEWIIVDSSPVNLVADSVNLARACDGVLFIVRSGNTRLEFARRALEELKASKLLGIVLNAVEDLPTSHTYYGYPSEEAGKDLDPAGR